MFTKTNKYVYKDPIFPIDQELENWKPLFELLASDIIKKLENKKRKDIVTDLTWKNIVRIPCDRSEDFALRTTFELEYEYYCLNNKIYQRGDGKASPVDTGLTEEDVNEIL